MKKAFCFIALVGVILLGILCIPAITQETLGEYCAFCDPKVLNKQKFYEDDLVIALYTHKPVFSGHCLIIPKRHVLRFEMLSDEEFSRICQVIDKVNEAVRKVFHTFPYLLLQKNGREVGQSVPHVHFHYIPRKEGDDSSLKFLFKLYSANLKNPISDDEMQKNVYDLQEAID